MTNVFKHKDIVVSYVKTHLEKGDMKQAAFYTQMLALMEEAPEVVQDILDELDSQRTHLKLIASENYSSLYTQYAMGNLLTDKYAEGYPNHRFYAGCDVVDTIEQRAVDLACKIFGADHASVQPHSGSDANLLAFWAILSAKVETKYLEEMGVKSVSDLSDRDWFDLRMKLGNQRLLGMDYYSGGHLTHGYRYNVSGKMFDCYSYGVSKETGLIDYDALEMQAIEVKPLILLVGYSAYPRLIDFKRMREIADKSGAVLMVDMAHFAGLVAGKAMTGNYDPVPFADVVTTTTHKTLRGPRGAMVLCKNDFAEYVNKGCPLMMGGPLPHMIAAKYVALKEIDTSDFQSYAAQIVKNAKALAFALEKEGLSILTGGTDNHLMLVNVSKQGLTGRQAESALRECGITMNRNALPYDPNGAWYTSGLRLGTPAITTLGMKEGEMKEIASIIADVIKVVKPEGDSKAKYVIDPAVVKTASNRVKTLLKKFPLYPELDLEALK